MQAVFDVYCAPDDEDVVETPSNHGMKRAYSPAVVSPTSVVAYDSSEMQCTEKGAIPVQFYAKCAAVGPQLKKPRAEH